MAYKGMQNSAHSDPVWSYKFRCLNAEIMVTHDPGEALKLLDPAPPPELSSGEFAARRKITQGLAYALSKDYPRAKASFADAALYAAASMPELMILVAFDQAYMAEMQNDLGAAEERYGVAIALAEKYRQSHREADAHINLGKLLMDHEFYDRAITEFNLAIKLARSVQAVYSEQMALGNMGWSYFQIGEFGLGADLLEQAANHAAKLGLKQDEQKWFQDLGVVSYVQQKDSEAERYYLKALALAKEQRLKDASALALHNLSLLELKRGHIDKADEYNHAAYAAEGLGLDDQSDPYLLLTTAEIAEARGNHGVAESILTVVIHHPRADSSLRWQAQSDLANLYVAKNEITKADEMFEQALHTVEAARSGVKQEDRRMSILDAWPFYDDYIRFLVNNNNAVKALQIAEFSRGRTLAEAFEIPQLQKNVRLQVGAVQSFLKKSHQIILAYWISDQESYLWALSGTQFQLFRLPAQKEIDTEVNAYSREIREHSDTRTSAHAQTLFEMLIKPAKKFLPPNANVIIVPNRSLYKLNFESLVVPGEKPHYWIEDAVLESASSILLLADGRQRRQGNLKKLLLMGAPAAASDEFPSLRFAGDEIKTVGHHFPGPLETIVTGKDATPSAYRDIHPGDYQFIHLVAHGIPNQTSPLDSAIILSADADKSFKLYASVIKDIRPLHADLVTLSACYSAGDKTYSGEGLVGLAWAFMRAGSHQVVAALWEVDDSAMPQLMNDFYGELNRGKSVAQSLRLAKLAVLNSNDFHRKPYYWASLQLYTGA